jgi:hypothetical protein
MSSRERNDGNAAPADIDHEERVQLKQGRADRQGAQERRAVAKIAKKQGRTG